MPHYTHGGDIWDKERDVLDFSANLNPLGAPDEVLAAAERAVREELCRYPDGLCTDLRRAIAAREGVTAGQVVCGSGGADLIFRLCQALRPRRALVPAPAFSEYAAALEAVGCEVVRHALDSEQNFDLDEDVLDAVTEDMDLVFVCTPNNPTGRLVPPALLEQLAARCRDVGAVLAVDECFMGLSDKPEWALTPLLAQYENLFLVRAFTKCYAIPGVRLGYGLCGNAALLERLYAVGQPWSVSAPAQAAGLAACGLPGWPEKGRAVIAAARPRLQAGLEALGLRVWPGQANYLLFRAEGVCDLKERLLTQGVLIRACANYPGLGPDYYRVCVKRAEDNGRLLAALREVL